MAFQKSCQQYMILLYCDASIGHRPIHVCYSWVHSFKTPKKKRHIKIEICIHGLEDGVLYHRKEILANKSWLIWVCFPSYKGKAVQQWRWCCRCNRTENTLQRGSCFIFSHQCLHGWRHKSVECNRKQVTLPQPGQTETDVQVYSAGTELCWGSCTARNTVNFTSNTQLLVPVHISSTCFPNTYIFLIIKPWYVMVCFISLISCLVWSWLFPLCAENSTVLHQIDYFNFWLLEVYFIRSSPEQSPAHWPNTTLLQHTPRSNRFLPTMIISITFLQQTDICA